MGLQHCGEPMLKYGVVYEGWNPFSGCSNSIGALMIDADPSEQPQPLSYDIVARKSTGGLLWFP